MKTYAGSALAALCLVGVAACGSSDNDGDVEASGAGSATTDSWAGQIQPLPGMSTVKFNAGWALAGGRLGKIGEDTIDPRTVSEVTCSGSGSDLSVSVTFPDGSKFAGESGSTDAVVAFPGLPEMRIVPESGLTWRTSGMQGLSAEFSTLVRDQIGDPSKLNPSVVGKFDVQC